MAGIKHSENCSECHEQIVATRHGKKLQLCDDCYRNGVIDRLKARKVRRTLTEGAIIQYYQDGWRVGYLIKMGPNRASIQPVGAKDGICPEILGVMLTDIKAEIYTSALFPTVEDYYRMTKHKAVPVLVAGRGVVSLAAEAVKKAEVSLQTMATFTVPEQHVIVNTEPVITGVDLATKTDYSPESIKVLKGMPLAGVTPKGVFGAPKHPPIDEAMVLKLNAEGVKISAIVEAVRGQRAAGGCGNLVRAILEKAGVYKRPVKGV